MDEQNILVSFDADDPVEWVAIHDVVMGGVSTGGLERTQAGTGFFTGELSLENNGGFASVRAILGKRDLSGHRGLELRIRGDGRSYQLRIRMDGNFDGVAYSASFDTEAGEWQTKQIVFDDFRPTFRGRTPQDAPPLDPARVHQIGLMLADKKTGKFSLEIDWIRAWRAATVGDES